MKILIQLGKNGDIAMVANHLLRSGVDPDEYIWMVTAPYHKILHELYPMFKTWVVRLKHGDVPNAIHMAQLRYPDGQIIDCQQHRFNEEISKSEIFSNYQQYQFFHATN